jgi:cbb3-type cytochrome oxidase subunit 3
MKLSDVMSEMGLAGFAEVAMAIFMLVFVAIVFQTFRRQSREVFERARSMPLDDETPQDLRTNSREEQR